ncbi:WD40-repeat-containing domain protein [Chiua virens]|nr:WD40-repeat-containing domain protein [Chiua virens]
MGTKPFEIACENITSLSFHPDDAYFVTGDCSGFLRQWSIIDKLQVSLWTMNTKEQINAVAVSADGRWIVSGGTGNKATIWSTMTRERVIEVAEHTGAICALDISNDSKRFASGSADDTVRIFDITSGSRLIPPLHLGCTVVGVKFAPDASCIAITAVVNNSYPKSSSSVRIYNASSGNQLSEILLQQIFERQIITPPAWSFDCKKIFVASPGKIVCADPSACSRSEWGIRRDGNNSQQVSITTSRQIHRIFHRFIGLVLGLGFTRTDRPDP